jgi:dihydrolipoamide dehydrogenase
MSNNKYRIVVIGAGAGGLVVAIGAAKSGKKVLLIERGNYGGDCTNFGCIPSKSLIASAHAGHLLQSMESLGLQTSVSTFQARGALERVRSIVSGVRSHEDQPALEQKGVKVLTGVARFKDNHSLEVKEADGQLHNVDGNSIIIATGSSPLIPKIKGLDNTPYLTNETIFDLQEMPKRLIVVGGGPIGCELSQAFQRLGVRVSIIHTHDQLLNKEELSAQQVIAKQFEKEGIKVHLNAQTQEVSYQEGIFTLTIQNKNSLQIEKIEAENLLISIGRRPNISQLNLEAANVNYTDKGIPVDSYGRTNIPNIWAIGDVIGGPLHTHVAEHHGRAVLTSLLLSPFYKKKIDEQAIPKVTYTDPEIASIGLSEHEATKSYGVSALAIYMLPLSSVDRAITAGRTEGFIKIITKKWSSQILGATIVAPRAGEMLCQISTAMYANIPLKTLAKIIHPYPTYSLAIRQTADLWLTQTILPSIKKIFKWRG